MTLATSRGIQQNDRPIKEFPMAHSARTAVLAAALLSGFMTTLAVSAGAPGEDESLRQRVALSLQEAPYFYDAHVIVSIEKGNVVLRGLVFSDWDLRDAIRIAKKAADGRRVIDNLSLVQGGQR
jgi:osmotically-inducible protein OsmY